MIDVEIAQSRDLDIECWQSGSAGPIRTRGMLSLRLGESRWFVAKALPVTIKPPFAD
jgi:hypothetical protein